MRANGRASGAELYCSRRFHSHSTQYSVRLISTRDDAYPADFAMVAFGGFLLKLLPLLHKFGVGEGNGVDPLKRLHVGFTLPIRRRVFCHLKQKKKKINRRRKRRKRRRRRRKRRKKRRKEEEKKGEEKEEEEEEEEEEKEEAISAEAMEEEDE